MLRPSFARKAYSGMISRRSFLSTSCSAIAVAKGFPSFETEPLISNGDLSFLRSLARDTVRSATKPDSAGSFGFEIVTPGGAYPSLWIRDFSMAAGCGLIPVKTLQAHLFAIAKAQNGSNARYLGERAEIPAFAVPDHINFQGGAVFFPGTYSSGDDQGGEPFGKLPPVDDHYEFIHIAHCLWRRQKSTDFLSAQVGDDSLYERLVAALSCPEVDVESGLVVTGSERRAVGFGFCDGVTLTGKLLYASLLRYRALGELADLSRAYGHTDRLEEWARERKKIRASIAPTFESSGWLKASTGVGQQPDVWGTIAAVALDAVEKKDVFAKTLAKAVGAGTITFEGGVRHVPTDHDFSPTSAWEKTAGEELNRYQNGAYWHVPSGHLAKVAWTVDKALARSLVRDMVAHFKAGDFRKGGDHGAPWECFHPSGNYRQNPVYMASVTFPLEALSKL